MPFVAVLHECKNISFQAPLEEAMHLPATAAQSRPSSVTVKKELENEFEIQCLHRNNEPECQVVAAKIKSKSLKLQGVKKEQGECEEVGILASSQSHPSSLLLLFPHLMKCTSVSLLVCTLSFQVVAVVMMVVVIVVVVVFVVHVIVVVVVVVIVAVVAAVVVES